MKRLLSSQPFSTDHPALLLRLILGSLFIFHGADKIIHYQLYSSMTKDIIGIGAQLT
jgi:uncharacterized membrane protein YphA (DoxX/SURF4 family)